MFRSRYVVITAAVLAAAAAWVKFGVLAGAGLALAFVAAALAWRRRAKGSRDALLQDPAISTLVFPPESKFQQSVLPPR